MADKERGPSDLKEIIPKNVPLDSRLKEELKELLVRGDIHKLLHWDSWGENPWKDLIRISPKETEVLVNNILFTEKQMEVLKLRLGMEVYSPMTTMETADFLGISRGAAYMREYGMLARLRSFLEAIRNPEIELLLVSAGTNREPLIVRNRPEELYRRTKMLGKLEINRGPFT